MRELNMQEVEQISGGFNGFTGAGQIFGAESIGAASRFAGGLGLIYGAYNVGYSAGTWINDNYGTQINSFVWDTFH